MLSGRCQRAIGAATALILSMTLTAGGATEPLKPVDLLAGAVWQYSIDAGKSFSSVPPVVAPGATQEIVATTHFAFRPGNVDIASLELTHALPPHAGQGYMLNGRKIPLPLKGMYYRTIRGIAPGFLKTGDNVLTANVTIRNRSEREISIVADMSLKALLPEHLTFQTRPLLGPAGRDFFTVICRTNMPAVVSVKASPLADTVADDRPRALPPVAKTSEGMIHHIRVPVTGGDTFTYRVVARYKGKPKSEVTFTGRVKLPPQSGLLRFAITGDNRTNPKLWANVAQAILAAKPDILLHTGDMVSYGRNEWEWDEQFFAPAAELLAAVPLYPVIGNHEAQAPLYDALFCPTGDPARRNWSQTIGSVLLVGIDGRGDWSATSKNIHWLERTLAESSAKFIFLISHYPPWTSGGHGQLDEDGRPREKSTREAQGVILPLLVTAKATAFVVGHDHFYERSEPPGGVTVVISGGAGAPLRAKSETADRQNPYSKVFASVLHYCLFTVSGDTCTMEAITPDGKVIDTRTWAAREQSLTDGAWAK